MIRCQEGYDGGLQQSFLLEIYDAEKLSMLNNLSNSSPVFSVYDLTPGTRFIIEIYAFNSKGRSEPKILRTSTLATPESLTQRGIFHHEFFKCVTNIINSEACSLGKCNFWIMKFALALTPNA